MNKILLIIQREYLTRVKKKSFIVMTIVGPVLMAAMIILPVFLASWSEATEKRIAVLDETGWFFEKFQDEDNIKFYHVFEGLEEEKNQALNVKGDLLLYIPLPELNIPVNAELFSSKQPGLNVTSYIKSIMKQTVENKKLLASGIDPEIIKSAKVDINLVSIKVDEGGIEKKSNTEVEVGLSIFAGIMIYFFIFMFGAQVLKGVIEEKSNRIVEVIISSVKPFQLMMGKIVGIALVGLTQFMLPVSIPLILAVAMSGVIINQPDSSLAFWMSMIPFTSPITMMMRIPFGVPVWEILLSMGLLVAGFIFSTWVAGKIYKTGILMYGKKISYGVIWKWLTAR